MRRVISEFEMLPDASLKSKVRESGGNIVKRYQWQLLVLLLMLNDVVMIALAFQLAFSIRFELAIPLFHLEVVPSTVFYQSLVRFLLPVWLLIFAIKGLYSRQNLLGGTREYSTVFNSTFIGMFLVIAFGFLQPDFVLARGWLLLAWLFAFLFTATGRFLIRRLVYFSRERGYYLTPAIIIGANDEGLSLAEQLAAWRRSGLKIIGFLDDNLPAGEKVFHHLSILGPISHLKSVIETHEVKEIIVSSSAFSRDELVEIFKQHGISDQVNLSMSSGLYEIITTGLRVQETASVPLVSINRVRLTGVDLVLKLLLDYAIALGVLVLGAPVFLLLALAIRLDSPGPVLHRRRVMGVNGKQFDAFKFRTMHVNGDEILANNPELKAELEANHKLKNDPRITRVGRLLRKASLDELPQFINVLRNEMSVIGPRMISPPEMKMYNQWGINLLTVKPGISGLWQVSGRSDVSYEERVRLDMQYIRNWSIWLDIQILIETIPAVLRQRGAY